MSLRVKEERLYVENQLGENTLQAVFQGTVELPVSAGEIARVVWVQGYPIINNVVAGEDNVQLQGVIDIQMVYLPEVLEGETAQLERVDWPGAIPFDHYVEIIGAESYMVPEANLDILNCEWEVRPDQRVIDLDVITTTTARVWQKQDFTILTGATIGPPKKLASDDLTLNTKTPIQKVDFTKEVSGILELPKEAERVKTVLDVKCSPVVAPCDIAQGKLLLNGTTTIDLIYAADDGSVHQMEFEGQLPFEYEHLDTKYTPEMEAQTRVTLDWEQFPVNEGAGVRIELNIAGHIDIYKKEQTRVLIDLVSPGDDSIESRKDTIYVDNFVNDKVHQSVAQGVIELGETLPPIREILRATGKPHIAEYRIDEDKVIVDGSVDVEIIYLAYTEEENKPLYMGVFPNVISFQQTVIISGAQPGMKAHVEVDVKELKPDLINRETIEVMATLRSKVNVTDYLQADVVVEAIEIAEPDPNPPSITYVFVQEKDTLWKLARKYHASEEAILESNPWLKEQLEPALKPGDKLCIPRK